MKFFDRLNWPKFDFMQTQSGGKSIKFQQSQALTSHFESFQSIVICISKILPHLTLQKEAIKYGCTYFVKMGQCRGLDISAFEKTQLLYQITTQQFLKVAIQAPQNLLLIFLCTYYYCHFHEFLICIFCVEMKSH